MNQEFTHKSVLWEEIKQYLDLKGEATICDATLGLGGHSLELLKGLPRSTLLGLDCDVNAIEIAKERLLATHPEHRLFFVHSNYSGVAAAHRRLNLPPLDAIIFDLGVSSMQLEDSERGFSFMKDGPLDMRMNASLTKTAADVVNTYCERELADVLFKFGEESFSRRLARVIVERRAHEPFATTLDLANFIAKHKPRGKGKTRINPATKSFQALRIEVNKELEHLREALIQAISVLKPGGRIAVISFHSLEDRIVKEIFQSQEKVCVCPPDIPICCCNKTPTLRILTKKPVTPGDKEIATNPRARSAKLRVGERL